MIWWSLEWQSSFACPMGKTIEGGLTRSRVPVTMLGCIHGSKAGYTCRPQMDKVAKEGKKSDALKLQDGPQIFSSTSIGTLYEHSSTLRLAFISGSDDPHCMFQY